MNQFLAIKMSVKYTVQGFEELAVTSQLQTPSLRGRRAYSESREHPRRPRAQTQPPLKSNRHGHGQSAEISFILKTEIISTDLIKYIEI